MDPSNEVEIKLRFDSPRTAVREIEKLGADLVEQRAFEDNGVYDLPSRALRMAGQLLRLRTKGSSSTLTFKSKVPGHARHKVYREHETGVDDVEQTHLLLTGLGYSRWYRYQKYRTVYRFDDVEIAIDETPIGCFVELEGDPEAIDGLAARLGCTPERYILETYHELHEAEAAARGVPAGDLVFERDR
jgi:adenylate cyclase class 2